MECYRIENLCFSYPTKNEFVLENINLEIKKGDFVLLCGSSGSGKTTLIRQLKKQVRPVGFHTGNIFYNGINLESLDESEEVQSIGMIFQDPDNQIVMNTVEQEISFAMENMAYPRNLMQRRLGEIVNFFSIENILKKPIHELSGGQKQIISLASVMVLRPDVLLLDEPTSQLDPITAKEFIQVLERINQELSITIIASEHRLEEFFPIVNKVVVLDKGKIVYDSIPNHLVSDIWNKKDKKFINYLPEISKLYLLLENKNYDDNRIPLTIKAAKKWFYEYCPIDNLSKEKVFLKNTSLNENNECVLCCKDLSFQYERNSPFILYKLSFSVGKGEIYTLFGSNGSGKSTFLKVLSGAVNGFKGNILFKKEKLKSVRRKEELIKIGYVAQNPLLYFTQDTVYEEFINRMKYLEISDLDKMNNIIEIFDIHKILDCHPYDISGGQRQKVVLALVLLSEPELILLDEPTKGLDPVSKIAFGELLNKLKDMGKTILIVSHDIEFSAKYSTKCGLLFDGKVVASDNPKDFFKENYFYTTAINRTVNDFFPEDIVIEDVTNRCKN